MQADRSQTKVSFTASVAPWLAIGWPAAFLVFADNTLFVDFPPQADDLSASRAALRAAVHPSSPSLMDVDLARRFIERFRFRIHSTRETTPGLHQPFAPVRVLGGHLTPVTANQ